MIRPDPFPQGGYRLAAVFIATAWLVFCWPWLGGGQIIPHDAKNHFYPMVRFLALAWHSGESPLWSPYHFGGFPMVADPQSVIFTPSFWPAVLAGPAPSMRLVDAIHLLHLLVMGLAILGFSRLRGWRVEAGAAAAICFMLSGALTVRLEHLLMTVSMMWLAVCLWRLEAVLTHGGIWRGIAFGVALGLMLIDRNHVAYLAAWFLGFYWLSRSWPGSGQMVPLRNQTPVILGGITALCLAAIPILLLLQLAEISNRPSFDYEGASIQSLHPAALATLFMVDIFGPLDRAGAYWGPASHAWGGQFFVHRGMLHGYVGALALVLILWHGIGAGRLWRREALVFTLLAILFLIYALGHYTPVFEWLYDTVPGIDLFRRPADALFLFGASAALLTGALMNDMLRAPSRLSTVGSLAALVLTISGAVFVGLLGAKQGHLADLGLPAARALAYSAILLALLIMAVRVRGTLQRSLLAAILLISAVDLITAHSNIRLNASLPQFYDQLETPAAYDHIARLAALSKATDPSGAPWRVETIGLGASSQNIGQAAGIEALLGYNPIRLRAFDSLIAPKHQNNASANRRFGTAMTSYDSVMADQLGLRYIMTGKPVEKIDGTLPQDALQEVAVIPYLDRNFYLYENRDAKPRAVLLPATDAGATPGPQPRITRYTNVVVEVSAKCTSPCRLVLHDFAYPGWTATANGVPVPLMIQDGLFRAVDLSVGQNEVTFTFSPLALENLQAALIGVLGGDGTP